MTVNLMFELIEAAEKTGVDEDIIKQYINYEWVSPIEPDELKLDIEDLARIELIWELKSGMGVNDESMSIILHLIDELNHLHLELKERSLN